MPNPIKQKLVIYSIEGEVFDSNSVEVLECPVLGVVQHGRPKCQEDPLWTKVQPLVFEEGQYLTVDELLYGSSDYRVLGFFDNSYNRSELTAMAERRHKQSLIIKKQT